jgi:hypothetical protein
MYSNKVKLIKVQNNLKCLAILNVQNPKKYKVKLIKVLKLIMLQIAGNSKKIKVKHLSKIRIKTNNKNKVRAHSKIKLNIKLNNNKQNRNNNNWIRVGLVNSKDKTKISRPQIR